MLMDTRQLAAFCAVVEKSSFSQAAEKLGVTQPAVSLQVRALEERLGQTLLDRSGRRVEPTEAGLRLYRSAQRMLALEEQLYDEVAAERARSRSAPPPVRARISSRFFSASSNASTQSCTWRSRSGTRRR
jgi:DNA-binding transcriptional LysR family regulator